MECVSSTTVSILLNGGKLDSFVLSCGLKQGNPLSSYLFIICIDYIIFLIKEETKVGSLVGGLLLSLKKRTSYLFHGSCLETMLSLWGLFRFKNYEIMKKNLDTFCKIPT